MKIGWRKGAGLFLLAVAMASSLPAEARVRTVQPSPSRKTIDAHGPVSIRIVWRVKGRAALSAPLDIEMGDGNFFIGDSSGVFLMTVPGGTVRRITTDKDGNFAVVFSEALEVPQDLINQVLSAKKDLFFEREFTDDSFTTSVLSGVVLHPGGGIGGDVSVKRLRLTFPEGEGLCSVSYGEELKAQALIQADGSGSLRGRWEVRKDQHGSSFRTIKTVRVPVNAGRDTILHSPSLPTELTGRVDVRFVLTDPKPDFDEPFITCLILGGDEHLFEAKGPGQEISVLSPAPYDPLVANTRIKWDGASSGYSFYRIVFLRKEDGAPVAAQDAVAGTTEIEISPLVLEKLDPKARYLVKVYGQK